MEVVRELPICLDVTAEVVYKLSVFPDVTTEVMHELPIKPEVTAEVNLRHFAGPIMPMEDTLELPACFDRAPVLFIMQRTGSQMVLFGYEISMSVVLVLL